MGGLRLSRPAVAVLAGGVLAVCASGADATRTIAGQPARFVNFEFAGTPPAPVGTVCPGSTVCWNRAVEPAIRADGDGVFYVASENSLFKGTVAAKSTDGGLHYASLPSPNVLSGGNAEGFAPGGGDADVAIAPERNAAETISVELPS